MQKCRSLARGALLGVLLAFSIVPAHAQRMGHSPASKTWDHKNHVYPVYDIRTEFAAARQHARETGHMDCCSKLNDQQAAYLLAHEAEDRALLAPFKTGRLAVGAAPPSTAATRLRSVPRSVSHSKPSVRPVGRPWWSWVVLGLAVLCPVAGYFRGVKKRRAAFLAFLQSASPAAASLRPASSVQGRPHKRGPA